MRNTILTAFLFPSLVATIFFILDMCLLFEGSSGAVPFSTFFTLIVLWFGVSTPLVFVGSYFGYKKEAYKPPVRVNLIPRPIPAQPWYMHPMLTVLFGGILPFGAVSVELFFIMSALWLHQGACVRVRVYVRVYVRVWWWCVCVFRVQYVKLICRHLHAPLTTHHAPPHAQSTTFSVSSSS